MIGLYKNGNNQIINTMFEHERTYLLGFIKRAKNKCNFENNINTKELIHEANLIFLQCIKNTSSNIIGQNIKYIEKCVIFKTLNYIYKNNKFDISYDDAIKYKTKNI